MSRDRIEIMVYGNGFMGDLVSHRHSLENGILVYGSSKVIGLFDWCIFTLSRATIARHYRHPTPIYNGKPLSSALPVGPPLVIWSI